MDKSISVSNDRKRKLSTSELCHLADNLFEQAVQANSFRCILQQYSKNLDTYQEEMSYSSAFYSIVYRALAISLTLLLSRIYDRNGNSLTIHNLINGMKEMTEVDLDPQIRKTYDSCNKTFHHTLKPIEEALFQDKVQETKQIVAAFGFEYRETTVQLSLQENVKLYQNRFRELKKGHTITNLLEQRNKIVAHNDSSTNFDFQTVFKQFPVSNNDVEMLVDFAIDCTQFVREIMTGVHTIPEYVNINDWEGSLQLVRIGMKYRDTHIDELVEEFFKEKL